MKRKLNILSGDTALWVIFFLLSGISLIAVYSSIGLSAITEHHATPMAVFFKHLEVVLFTYVVIIAVSHFNYRIFAKASQWLFVLSVLLLVLVLIFHTERWLEVPYVGRFQPSEVAKIVLLVFTARNIAVNRERLDDPTTYYLILVPVLLICLLVMPENLSTAILIFLSCYLVLLFGGVCKQLWWKWFLILMGVSVLFFVFLYFFGDDIKLFRSPTWGHRLQNWLHPDPDELSQENIARMAVARGGFFHNGIGTTIHGRLMSQAYNDFIFAIIIEEVGSLVGLFIFALYAWFYFRCIRIASRCRGLFGSLSVAGIGTIIFLQALVHMSVALGVLPVTGQTLPFISYGGTAYVCMGCGIGIIQAVAADNKRQERKLQQQQSAEAQVSDPTTNTNSNNQNNSET
ncbi:MAG: FtsW/RodA/SpoVE family cell cycle protein [Bacteroidales bacterium]|nr:FtsW/RodA/SpoVE family cell cycle protein [Bacteroidales bacterium]MBR3412479.1 FtsW/RodA/SpoVE family cell cycle protein [Bacteroidales bacterium]